MRLTRLLPLALLLVPTLAFAAGINTDYIRDLTTGDTGIVGVINKYIVPVVFTLALLVFLYGVARAYILKASSEAERAKGHQLIIWGIIGFVVMLSVWGIVNIARTTLGLNGNADSPPTPVIKVN